MPSGYLDAADDSAMQATLTYKLQEPETQYLTVVNPSKRLTWPFHTVTHRRVMDLRAALGPKAGLEAMRDIDSLLDAAVTKWERVASLKKKSS